MNTWSRLSLDPPAFVGQLNMLYSPRRQCIDGLKAAPRHRAKAALLRLCRWSDINNAGAGETARATRRSATLHMYAVGGTGAVSEAVGCLLYQLIYISKATAWPPRQILKASDCTPLQSCRGRHAAGGAHG